MVDYFTRALINHLIIFQGVLLLVILSNIWITHRIRRYPTPEVYPMVSILIPVRNEERCIGDCLQSLLAQDYPSFEVLVLDDQSSDGTRAILEKIAAAQPKLRILDGEPPTDKQVGKNWACCQLARQAQGDLLYFTDADTHSRSDTLKIIVTSLIGEGADLLTGFPRQEVHTWGERLLVPFFSWAFLSFIPLSLAYKLQFPFLSIAVGQMMLFRREAYLAIGGHEGVSSSMVEDISLARQVNKKRLRWRVAYVADLISCRMYQTSREAVDGFTRNLFAAFDYRLIPFLFAFIWLFMMFLEPLMVLVVRAAGGASPAQPAALAACLALSILLWLVPYAEMRIPVWLSFLYPVTIVANIGVALRSLVYTLRGRVTWKDRAIDKPRWRWF